MVEDEEGESEEAAALRRENLKKKIPYEDWFMIKEAEKMLKTKLIKTITQEIKNELID